MKSKQSIILSDFEEYFLDEDGKMSKLQCLPFTNKINIFIGTNNSGKSKFIRKLLMKPNITFLNEELLYQYNESIVNMRRKDLKTLNRNEDLNQQINFLRSRYNYFSYFNFNNLVFKKENIHFIYIPTLRTAHSLFQQTNDSISHSEVFTKIEDDIFLHTLKKNFNLGNHIDIFTGVHLYKDILNTRNSKKETRLKFENFERFISKYFFDQKVVDIIAEFDKDANRKNINTKEIISIHIEGEKHSRDLHHLGDGIQALIILMYKIFMADENSYIFIDEPEINLHPGMQRLFLEQITSNPDLTEKNLTYYISTHSNHFLDLTLEEENISIYSFRAELDEDGEKKLIVKNVNRGDNDILKNIGVNNSSVFMANCSLWVEGISDRTYIRAFLKSYCNYLNVSFPKEDIDFAFFEYAGSNLDHYFFDDDIEENEEDKIIYDISAMSLSNRIFLIADGDNVTDGSSKGKRLQKLEKSTSKNFVPKIIKSHREIENLLTNEVWEKLLINLCNKKLVGSNKSDIEEKIQGVLEKVDSQAYKQNYIGYFLNTIRKELGEISEKYILNKSEYKSFEGDRFGTLENKRALSEAFAKQEFSWDILSKNPQIEELTIDIFNFIKNR